MRLCFFGATDENLAEADICMSFRKIAIKLQRPLTFGDAFCGALGPQVNEFPATYGRADGPGPRTEP